MVCIENVRDGLTQMIRSLQCDMRLTVVTSPIAPRFVSSKQRLDCVGTSLSNMS